MNSNYSFLKKIQVIPFKFHNKEFGKIIIAL